MSYYIFYLDIGVNRHYYDKDMEMNPEERQAEYTKIHKIIVDVMSKNEPFCKIIKNQEKKYCKVCYGARVYKNGAVVMKHGESCGCNESLLISTCAYNLLETGIMFNDIKDHYGDIISKLSLHFPEKEFIGYIKYRDADMCYEESEIEKIIFKNGLCKHEEDFLKFLEEELGEKTLNEFRKRFEEKTSFKPFTHKAVIDA